MLHVSASELRTGDVVTYSIDDVVPINLRAAVTILY